jgi:hypothetical protein
VLNISSTFRSTRETGFLAFSPLLSRGTEGSNPAPSSGVSLSPASALEEAKQHFSDAFYRGGGSLATYRYGWHLANQGWSR